MLKLPNELNEIDPLPRLGAKIVEPTQPVPEPQSDWECATISDMLVVRPVDIDLAKTEDGWIPHTPGDPMPCGPCENVQVRLRSGVESQARQGVVWEWCAFEGGSWEIIAWRRA